jgi:hypothetical protein
MLVTLLLTAGVTAIPAPAGAATSFDVRADIEPNGAAFAWLSDTLMPSNRYLLTLTATGGGTCGVPGPTVQIVDTDVQGYANPVSAATSGACTLRDASVVYTVTWNGNPGTSGQVPIHCVWANGAQQCTPSTFSIVVP